MARWLTAEYGSDSFEPATGALQAWNELSTHPVWKRAVATGNWEFSARYKLSHAGYELRGVPLASADDGEAREQVLEAAKKKSLSEYGCAEFDKVVYIGDWIWDVKAAKALGWEFIGIAKNEDAHTLRYAGAERILQDFMGLIPELEKL
jgi:phosphoglycolate phosphatase-like HAD superfamily hydrolase